MIRENVFNYIHLHTDVLSSILQLPKYTGEIEALKLVKSAILLYCTAMKWQLKWLSECKESFENVVVYIVFNFFYSNSLHCYNFHFLFN